MAFENLPFLLSGMTVLFEMGHSSTQSLASFYIQSCGSGTFFLHQVYERENVAFHELDLSDICLRIISAISLLS